MAQLFEDGGAEAAVGKSEGYWLCEADFFSTDEARSAQRLGKLGFPRDWPAVYTGSKALKSLIGKKGRCAGKKVAVVPDPLPEELTLVKGIVLRRLQSFANAELIQRRAGLAIVQGWAVYEHHDLPVSEAFVAERYWWNALPDGKWVDFTPRPREWQDMLLAEAAGDASKSKAVLKTEEHEIAMCLFKQRFALEPAAPPRSAATAAGAVPAASSTVSPAEATPSLTPAALRGIIERVKAGEAAALRELEEKLKNDEEECIKVAGSGVVPSLVRMLGQESVREDALKLVLLLTDAGVGQKKIDVAKAMIAEGVVQPLAQIVATANPTLQELAAASLGNLCHESPANQDKVAKADVFTPLVKLLAADTGPAQEAAYAIWNLTVGHEENSEKFARLGCVPELAKLLQSSSDVAQENAAGALMHVTITAAARSAIVEANAIPRLVQLLSNEFEPEVSSQAAGALLNLASDCPEYAKMIVKAKAVEPLTALVKEGQDLAREYAAGALMNLIRNEVEVAATAAKAGAVPALAGLLARGASGQAEALGALANLASGSPERQVAIYKAQVTRRSVAALSDADVDVRRSAAALIMNLAPQVKIKERIVEAGALRPLAANLKDSDAAVRERAAGALANLFNDHSANVHAGFEQAPDMVAALVGVVQDAAQSEEARRQAAHALAMLAAEDGPCDAVWTAGAGPPLLALLKDLVSEAALAIMNLSWRWPEVKQELANSGAIGYLTQMMTKGSDAMSKEYAAGALMNMTAGSADIAEKAVGVVGPLVQLLKEDSIQGAEWSAGALANIVRVAEAPQKEAASLGAPALLAALLTKASANGRPLVVLALTSLVEHQADAVRQAISGAKEKAKLREFRDSGDEELRDYTNTLADKLGAGFAL